MEYEMDLGWNVGGNEQFCMAACWYGEGEGLPGEKGRIRISNEPRVGGFIILAQHTQTEIGGGQSYSIDTTH